MKKTEEAAGQKAVAANRRKSIQLAKPRPEHVQPIPEVAVQGTVPSPAELSKEIQRALDSVTDALFNFQRSSWNLALALAKLKFACQSENRQYLEVCKEHLQDWGFEKFSVSFISKMAQAGEYVSARNKVVTGDPKRLPSYSQVFPLYRFIDKNRPAKLLQKQWDELEAEVFDTDPAKRPCAATVRVRVAVLFAPPTPPANKGKADEAPSPGLPVEEVMPEAFSDWCKANFENGVLQIHRVRIAKMSADALASAIKASWKTLKDAKLIRIEVVK